MEFTDESFSGIRHDALDKFFQLSGATGVEEQVHLPYIIFTEQGVSLCFWLSELVQMPRETWVMRQWPGKMRSDFFRFQVGELVDYLEKEASADVQ